MNIKVKLLILMAIFLACGVLLGCQKKKSVVIPRGQEVTLSDVGNDIYDLTDETRIHSDTHGTVAILFGWGYNDKNFIAVILDKLANYKILPLVFPDDFKHGSKTYVTNLTTLVSGVDLRGIVLLGAPQNASVAVTRLSNAWGGGLPYPVFNLFGQDDIDAMEATSDIVLELQADKKNTVANGAADSTMPKNIDSIIENAVKYCTYTDSSFHRDTTLLQLAQMIAGDSVTFYVDSSTGLKSVNHFVLKE